MEVWLDIEEFESKYRISNKGQVMSLNYNNTGKPKILKPKVNKQGHLEVTLNKGNKHYYKLVSRLVFETFTGIKLGKNDILMYHDNNKENPAFENLYLITRGNRQEITYDMDKRHRYKYKFQGEILTIKEIAKRAGILPKQARDRIRKLNWSIYECEIPIAITGKGAIR